MRTVFATVFRCSPRGKLSRIHRLKRPAQQVKVRSKRGRRRGQPWRPRLTRGLIGLRYFLHENSGKLFQVKPYNPANHDVFHGSGKDSFTPHEPFAFRTHDQSYSTPLSIEEIFNLNSQVADALLAPFFCKRTSVIPILMLGDCEGLSMFALLSQPHLSSRLQTFVGF